MDTNDVPTYRRAYEYLAHYEDSRPDSEAVVDKGHRYSYRELRNLVDTCAKALLANGVQPRDRIAYLTPPCIEFVVLLLATQAVGAIAVGINPKYQAREISHILRDSLPALVFSRQLSSGNSEQLTSVEAAIEDCGTNIRAIALDSSVADTKHESWKRFLASSNQGKNIDLQSHVMATHPDHPSLIIYTSGTTGAPKGAVLKQSAALRHGQLSLQMFRPDPMRVINYYPTNHVSGVVANTLQTLIAGGTLICLEKFDPETVLETIESEQITQWGGIPTMFQMCLAHERFKATDLSSVQLLSWGGSAAPESMVKTFAQLVPRMTTLYAMSETTGALTLVSPTTDIDLLTLSVGKPLHDVEMCLVDDNEQDVKQGEAGEILVRGPFLMTEYWRNSQATESAFSSDGWFRTGDMGKWLSDNSLQIVGRKSTMFKSGGYNVYPQEVEDVLISHEGIRDAVVLGAQNELYGEIGVAFICRVRSKTALDESEVVQFCRSRLANYKIPKCICWLDQLPMLPGGKLDRRALAERAITAAGTLDKE